MGVESYLLRMTGSRSDLDRIVAFSSCELGLVQDDEQRPLSDAYTCYVLRGDRHVIEFQFYRGDKNCQVSMRFSFCHPPSVDSIFIRCALTLMRRFDLRATICEAPPSAEGRDYTLSEESTFISDCKWSIDYNRNLWHQMFGTEEAGLSIADAQAKFFHNEDVASLSVSIR